jgi:uncharacterized protein
MSETSDIISPAVVRRLLRANIPARVMQLSISGPHAYGYAHDNSPIELKGIHVEPTERIVGLVRPPRAINWIGEFEGYRIDYSSLEIEAALNQLLKGDGSMNERILATGQLLPGDDLTQIRRLVKAAISKRIHGHYRKFAMGVMRDYEDGEKRTVRHLLGAYRTALTGAHLLRTGELELNLSELAKRYGFAKLDSLIAICHKKDRAYLEEKSPWINRMVKLHGLLEESAEISELPRDPVNPTLVEDFLLDIRRRFFDAPTVQEDI